MHRISASLAEPATLQMRRVLATRKWPSQEETLAYVESQLDSADQFLSRSIPQLDALISKVSGAGDSLLPVVLVGRYAAINFRQLRPASIYFYPRPLSTSTVHIGAAVQGCRWI